MPSERLRIALVSGYFPPKAPMGAVRPGKLAEYWRDCGHDVRVVSVALPPQQWAHEQASSVTADYIAYSEPGRFVTRLKAAIAQSLRRVMASAGGAKTGQRSGAWNLNGGGQQKKPGFAEFYRQALLLPDRYRSWIRPAVRFAESWQGRWQPDIIYSTGPPNSGHMVAKIIAKRFSAPWIAELRDVWMDNPYSDQHWLIKDVFNSQARRTLRHAAGFVVVTSADRREMTASFRAPVVLSYNGYDPKDFQQIGQAGPLDRERLTIIHAGVIYPGRRDPTPLFRAIASLGAQAGRVRCLFYGDQTGTIAALAQACGVAPYVETGDVLPRSQILLLERQADILLECHWQDPAGDGVIPGKLFEYIGARRPILSIGSLTAEAAVIIRENGLGLASNDPAEIRDFLQGCLEQKALPGRVPDITAAADERFTRPYQFKKIDDLMQDIVAETAASRT